MFDTDVARVITTPTGNPMNLPTIDDTGSTAGAHTEGAALTDDGGKDAVIGRAVLGAYGFDTEFIRWSWELDADSIFDMELLLASLLGERLARLGNAQLTIGTGNDAPHGIVTASSLGKTAAGATAIAADELIDLQHSVRAPYRRSPKCRWQFADTTLQAIRKLKDGQGNYLWKQGDVQTGVPDLLLGKPYSVNDDVPEIATGARAVIFGDHSKYFVRKVGSPVIGVLRERFWPDLGIAGLMRLDGELADPNAIKHLKLG
jgi:HK97 family phage major capsid protein